MHRDSASQQPLCTTLHCRPTGNKKGGVTSYRTQTEIAMCFAWGTDTHCTRVCVITTRQGVYVHHGATCVLPHTNICSRHPPHCLYAVHYHMCIVVRWHTQPQDQPVPGARTCQGR